ncbi:MAG: HD-GYP domain-containing protein [Firmicutes bacterium]|nr:HD-GYP domain-containing protein [Bacillota bacterium]
MRVVIRVDALVPGSRLLRDVYSQHGALLLRKGTILTQEHVQTLRDQHLDEVVIELEDGGNQTPLSVGGVAPGDPSASLASLGHSGRVAVARRPGGAAAPAADPGWAAARSRSEALRPYENALAVIRQATETLRTSGGQAFPAQEVDAVAVFVVQEARRTYRVLSLLVQLRQASDPTFIHSLNVALVAGLIARWMGWGKDGMHQAVQAGLLHDVGKSLVAPEILNKPEPLTPAERAQMQEHVRAGYELVRNASEVSQDIALAVLQHHERMDGSGYPQGLVGEEATFLSRLVAVADVYAAMMADRAYRRRLGPFRAAEELEDESFSRLDPQITRVFLDRVAAFYVGSTVVLSDGRVGQVVFMDPREPSRPLVRVEKEFIDLSRRHELEINDILML